MPYEGGGYDKGGVSKMLDESNDTLIWVEFKHV